MGELTFSIIWAFLNPLSYVKFKLEQLNGGNSQPASRKPALLAILVVAAAAADHVDLAS